MDKLAAAKPKVLKDVDHGGEMHYFDFETTYCDKETEKDYYGKHHFRIFRLGDKILIHLDTDLDTVHCVGRSITFELEDA